VSNAPSKPVSFSRPKVGYFSNRPRIVKLMLAPFHHSKSENIGEEISAQEDRFHHINEVLQHFMEKRQGYTIF